MWIIDFTHPLTPDQVSQIEALAGQPVERTIHASVSFDDSKPFVPQVVALADACGLTSAEWQTAPLLVVPPALNFISVALLAELHGRMGHFPACIRLRAASVVPPCYEVAEITPLDTVRGAARSRR